MTLVDSADGIAATLAAVVQACPGGEGVRIGRAEVWPWVGLPLLPTVQALAPQIDSELAVREYRARYAEIGVPLTRILPGAAEAFRAIHAAGGRVLVVSAKAEAGVRNVLAGVGLEHGELAPDLVVGGLFGAAKGATLLKEGADVYVGDHSGDVQAARVAGAISVAVTTGPQTEAVLVAVGADVILSDLLAFPKWLSSLLPDFSRSRVTR